MVILVYYTVLRNAVLCYTIVYYYAILTVLYYTILYAVPCDGQFGNYDFLCQVAASCPAGRYQSGTHTDSSLGKDRPTCYNCPAGKCLFYICYAALCCAMLYPTILYYTMLYHTVLYYTLPYYRSNLSCSISWYAMLCYTIINLTMLCYARLYHTILCHTIIYNTIL